MVSGERTERLVDLLAQLIESARAGEGAEAEELMDGIDRTGVALREDFEAWREIESERRSAETAPAETDPTPDREREEGAEPDDSDADSDAPAAEEVPENETVRVTVLGEVNRAGAYELEAGSTILDALGQAGGWTGEADLGGGILLQESRSLPLDVDSMIESGGAWSLEDGDTIVLRESSD